MVEEFNYLGTALTNQNSIQEEIKSKLNSGNVCYHLVQNHLSSSWPTKNLMNKILLLLFSLALRPSMAMATSFHEVS
jgi:hypothetical protein